MNFSTLVFRSLAVLFISIVPDIILTSCSKTSDLQTAIAGPSLILTPSTASGLAADQIVIDFSTSATKGIKSIKVEVQYNGNASKTLLDSVCSKKPLLVDQNYYYYIPDSASAGQKSILSFTIADSSGTIVTKQVTISVTGSRPRITVNQNKMTAHAGDSVLFAISMKSTEKNLDSLIISQFVNSGPLTKITGIYESNQSAIVSNYTYHVAKNQNTGDHLAIFFKIKNTAGVSTTVNKAITVN